MSDFAARAAPLALHPHRRRPPLREAAGIKGDDAIGGPQRLAHLSDPHRAQRAMLPGRWADDLLQDHALDLDQRRDGLGMLARHVRQQPLAVEVPMALAGFRLKNMLIGHHEVTQALHHGVEDSRGNAASTPSRFLPLCPRRGHRFASSQWHAATGC
jgi:hypothetical protein